MKFLSRTLYFDAQGEFIRHDRLVYDFVPAVPLTRCPSRHSAIGVRLTPSYDRLDVYSPTTGEWIGTGVARLADGRRNEDAIKMLADAVPQT